MTAVLTAVIVAFGVPAAGVARAPAEIRLHPDVPVTAVDIRLPASQNSPALAADPTDPSFVVLANRIDAPDYSCALQLSHDGGMTWLPARPVPVLPAGAEKCYAPEVAFDDAGVLHYLFVGLHGRGNVPMGAFLVTSRNGGVRFSEPREVLGPFSFAVRMAIDRSLGKHGRLHLVWLAASGPPPTGGLPSGGNPILTAFSDDGGRTLSKPQRLSDPSRPRAVAPAIAIGPDHAVHVAYYDLVDDAVDYQGLEGPTWGGTWSLVVSTSRDGGVSFDPGTVVDAEITPPERVILIFTMPPPALAAGPAGDVYVAWTDGRNGDWDVLLRRSADGSRWSDLVRVNDDLQGNGRHQYLPRLAVAPGGRLDVVFHDRRTDPENLRYDAYFTTSDDAGRTFSSNVRLSAESSDSRTGARYLVPSAKDLVDVGSRVGLIASDDRSVAAWADTRNTFGPPDLVAGPVGQDIYAATVTFGSAPVSPSAGAANRERGGNALAPLVGVGAAIVAVVLVSLAWRRRAHARRPTG